MRDGVTLYADVYRPVGGRALSGPRLANALQHRALPHRLRCGRLLRAARLRLRVSGRPGTPRIGGTLGAVLRRREGRLRHGRVGGEAALVERQGRHAGRLLPGPEPVAGRAGRAAQPRHHLPDGGLHQPLPRLDHAQRRLAPVVQLRLGTRSARNRGSCRTPGRTRSTGLRAIHYDEVQWHLPLEHDAAAGGTQRALLRRLAGPPRLRRLLEAAQRRRSCSTRSRSRCTRSAAGSTSSARAPCADTSG